VVPAVWTARSAPVAAAIRQARLIVVLRRVTPRNRLLELVGELAEAGASVFEITFDGDDPEADLAAVRDALGAAGRDGWVGAGTLRTTEQVARAVNASAAFGVSPILDAAVMAAAAEAGMPFVPGAFSPTEAEAAWRAGAAFVKLFPASSLGPAFVRELRGPLPEVETIVTGGVDASKALAFLEAGAVAVGIGSALVRAGASERREIVERLAGAARPDGR
jgi:2-dehydro-3-deoxyphosphogluconate aldolase/(4S)-4-hydroxy-2-oxoglutarate aldolase